MSYFNTSTHRRVDSLDSIFCTGDANSGFTTIRGMLDMQTWIERHLQVMRLPLPLCGQLLYMIYQVPDPTDCVVHHYGRCCAEDPRDMDGKLPTKCFQGPWKSSFRRAANLSKGRTSTIRDRLLPNENASKYLDIHAIAARPTRAIFEVNTCRSIIQ